MGRHHLIRVGALGQVGRFTSVDAALYPRGTRVIVRTARGLEMGEVLASQRDAVARPGDGSLLRAMTAQDRLLEVRLEKNKRAAYAACALRLDELGLPVVLVDVEHLFDGRTLIFYFLGEVSPELEAVTEELAELYESEVQFRRFAETVSEGCGPGCGTDLAGGGCSSCSTGCAIAGACGGRAAPPVAAQA